MLTEYSTYDEIRAFRDKVLEKYNDMKVGWLGKEIVRQLLEWKRRGGVKSYTKSFVRTFKVDNQEVTFNLTPLIDKDGRLITDKYGFGLSTFVETKQGKMSYTFPKSEKDIHITTPHYRKRINERFDCDMIPDIINCERVPYMRNGRKYELILHKDSVMITRRIEEDIIIFITFLHKDMCTGMNYQNIIERAGTIIDTDDVYEWV